MLVKYHSMKRNEIRTVYLDNDSVLELTEVYNKSKKAQKQYKNVKQYIEAVMRFND